LAAALILILLAFGCASGSPVPSSPVSPSAAYQEYSHASDYSWVCGKLFWSEIEGGFWSVRYSLNEKEDKYGGHFVLGLDPKLQGFRDGDMVLVKGVISTKASIWTAGTLYEISEIKKL